MKRQIEILAPAGSYEGMKAAMNAGCDAVYIGGNSFGARAYANNLDQDTLLRAIDEAHIRDKKLYLTVNTLLKEKELTSQLYSFLEKFYLQGLDAVIVQDLGVLHFIHKHFPDLPIHASTQMTLTMAQGANLLKDSGVTRLVTSRELSLKEIKSIRENTDLEIETFVHGALCYCYSGQCLMSSLIGGRSGNRGRCAQPCRMPYQFSEENNRISDDQEKYLLSPKDINTLGLIPDLIEAGIDSFKIEGRMKRPEYAAAVAMLYRKYVDLYLDKGLENYKEQLQSDEYKQDMIMLQDVYNRGGFSEGYGKTYHGKSMMSLYRPNHSGVLVGVVNEVKGSQVSISVKEAIHAQDILEIRRNDEEGYEFTVKDPHQPGDILRTNVGFRPDNSFKEGESFNKNQGKGFNKNNFNSHSLNNNGPYKNGHNNKNKNNNTQNSNNQNNKLGNKNTNSSLNNKNLNNNILNNNLNNNLNNKNQGNKNQDIKYLSNNNQAIVKQYNNPKFNGFSIRVGDQVYRTKNNELLESLAGEYLSKDRKLGIHGVLKAKVGEQLSLNVTYGEHSVTAYREVVQEAQKQPMTKDKLLVPLEKTGDTLYYFKDLQVEADDNIFVPVAWLNEIRREAIQLLQEAVTDWYQRKLPMEKISDSNSFTIEDSKETFMESDSEQSLEKTHNYIRSGNDAMSISITLQTKEQFEAVLGYSEIHAIYVDYDTFSIEDVIRMSERTIASGKKFYLSLPHICRISVYSRLKLDLLEIIENEDISGFLVKNLEEVSLLQSLWLEGRPKKEIILNYNMYIFNMEAKAFWSEKGITHYTAPVELNYQELKTLGIQDSDIVVYGYLPLMISTQCLYESTQGCKKVEGKGKGKNNVVGFNGYMTDRMGKNFFVRTNCRSCYNTIYNGQALALHKQASEIKYLNPRNIRLDFTMENDTQTKLVIETFLDRYYNGKERTKELEDYTTGHFKRGVE